MFLNFRRIGKGAEYTHTRLGAFSSSYYISMEDMDEFFDLYNRALDAGADLHLTEKHRHVSPVCIDVDLRFAKQGQRLERVYTPADVDAIVAAHVDGLAKYVGIDALIGKDFYVLEKPAPRLDKTGDLVKDGLHIMAPDVVTRPSIQLLARATHAVGACRPTFEAMGIVNSVEDALDEAVIARNNWFLYGSKKPDDHAYKLTRVVRVVRRNDDAYELRDSPSFDGVGDLVRRLSLRNKHDEIPPLPEVVVEVRLHETTEVAKKKRNTSERNILSTDPKHVAQKVQYEGDDIERIKDLVAMLSVDRINTYESWMRLGWCLRNIDDSLIDVWIDISKRSPKYVQGECERLWGRMRKGTLSVATLHMWAKADSPTRYKELRSASLHDLVIDCLTGTHHDVARVVYAMFKHRFVCSGIRSHQWYEFTDHRWKTCDSGYALRKRLSTDVWREFSSAVSRLNQRAMSSPGHLEQQRLQDMTKQVLEIAQKLKMALFKDHVMKECAELFYLERFEEKLDATTHLIGFENGVYDLDTDEFRDGRPDDYITFSTGNNYVEYDPDSEASDGVQKYLAQVLTNPDVRNYVMYLFSSFLHGQTKEQKFYVWTGSGSNSKSKLVELFEMAFGDYCCKLPITLLTQKRAASNAATSEVAKAKGKRFACLQEPSEDEKMNIGLMKELSGGDKIMARCIYKEPVEFKPQFKMVLLCNDLPSVPSSDLGTWRRIRVVKFTSKFVENPKPFENQQEQEFPIDVKLSDKMTTWKEAFMALLIEYYKMYSVDFKIVEPDAVTAETKQYQLESDYIQEFIVNHVIKEDGAFLRFKDCEEQAKALARNASIKFNMGNFKTHLVRQLGGNAKKSEDAGGRSGVAGFRYKPESSGIKIQSDEDEAEEEAANVAEAAKASSKDP